MTDVVKNLHEIVKNAADEQEPIEDQNDDEALKTDAGRGYVIMARRWAIANKVKFHFASHSYYWKDDNYTISALARHMSLHLTYKGKRLAPGLLNTALHEVAAEERKTYVDGLRQRICRSSRTSDDLLRKWLKELLVPDLDAEEFENCVAVLKQWIWLTQRALMGMKQAWHVMPVFWGGQGGGKSENIKKFLGPLGSLWDEASFAVFNSTSFNSMPMHFCFALLLDEMQNVESADSAAIKRALSSDYILGRGMFSEDGRHVKRNASFMGVTNVPPPHGLQDTTGARRFYSLECSKAPCSLGSERKKFFDDLDYLEIWRCVDPFSSAPWLPRQNQISVRQNDVNRARSPLEEFLTERCEPAQDTEQELPFRVFTSAFRSYLLERNLKNVPVPAYRALKSQFDILGVKSVCRANNYYLVGTKFQEGAGEDEGA